jgi:hypothetical protein
VAEVRSEEKFTTFLNAPMKRELPLYEETR